MKTKIRLLHTAEKHYDLFQRNVYRRSKWNSFLLRCNVTYHHTASLALKRMHNYPPI